MVPRPPIPPPPLPPVREQYQVEPLLPPVPRAEPKERQEERADDPRLKLMRRLEVKKEAKAREPKIGEILEKLAVKEPVKEVTQEPEAGKPKTRFARVREKMAEKAKDSGGP